ncbi:hypothetical protein WLQ65_22945 [Pseudoalteromonas piscicida]|uniref:hypothetical protein n=1 Tax=Pseudoalteromonas piscicida TaxID=43662 RepID=UPI0030C9337E
MFKEKNLPNTDVIVKLRKEAIKMSQISSIQRDHQGVRVGVIPDEVAEKIIQHQINIDTVKKLFPLQNGILVGKDVVLNTSDRNTDNWRSTNKKIMRLIKNIESSSSRIGTGIILDTDSDGKYRLISGCEKLFEWVFNNGMAVPCDIHIVCDLDSE